MLSIDDAPAEIKQEVVVIYERITQKAASQNGVQDLPSIGE